MCPQRCDRLVVVGQTPSGNFGTGGVALREFELGSLGFNVRLSLVISA